MFQFELLGKRAPDSVFQHGSGSYIGKFKETDDYTEIAFQYTYMWFC
jgi:hypothetical protein